MKIEIEIPEWAEDRHIFVIAGNECVAVKYAKEDVIYTKTERCRYYTGDFCGLCCEDCFNLSETGCKLVERPLMCCIDHPKQVLENCPKCAIRYRVG